MSFVNILRREGGWGIAERKFLFYFQYVPVNDFHLTVLFQTTGELRELAENCFRNLEYFQEQGPEAITKNIRHPPPPLGIFCYIDRYLPEVNFPCGSRAMSQRPFTILFLLGRYRYTYLAPVTHIIVL